MAVDQERKKLADELYEEYGKPLEAEHQGEYVAIAPGWQDYPGHNGAGGGAKSCEGLRSGQLPFQSGGEGCLAMAVSSRLVSRRFPYLPIHLAVRHTRDHLDAFLDTGFDGDIAVPHTSIADGDPPGGYLSCRLADGSDMLSPFYRGTIRVGGLGSFSVVIVALGDEPLVRRGVSDRFKVILDHGHQLIVEP